MNKQIIYLLVITLLALSSSLYAQVTKAIPEETPDVPHFIQLQKTTGGTLTGKANVDGINSPINIPIGENVDLPHGTQITLTAQADKGWKFVHIKDIESDEIISTTSSCTYILEKNAALKAIFAEEGTYSISLENSPNVEIVGESAITVKEGDPLAITIQAKANYLLPETIKMMENGKETNDFSYEKKTDGTTASIKKNKVNGDISIIIEAIDNHIYTITYQLTNLRADNEVGDGMRLDEIKANESIKIILIPNNGYKAPDDITVTMDDLILTNVYTLKTDDISSLGEINIEKVTGNIVIKADAVKKEAESYQITATLSNLAATIPEQIVKNQPLSFTFKANKNYNLPTTIIVTMGDKTLTAGKDYTYNSITGEFKISAVTGEVTIKAEATKIGTEDNFEVSFNPDAMDSNIQISGLPENILSGEPLSLKLSVKEGYSLPKTIVVKMSGKTLSTGTDYTYNAQTGAIEIKVVTGDIEIIATATQVTEPEDPDNPDTPTTPDSPNYFNIYVEDYEGIKIILDSKSIKEGGTLHFAIEINDKYNADNIQVFVKRGKSGNIEKLKSDKKGEYKYTISNIRTNIYITVEGIEEENPTGIEGITGVKVYTQDGSLFVYTPKQEKVMIISMGGAIVKDESQVGLKQYTGLQRGIYIICIGEEKIKMKI